MADSPCGLFQNEVFIDTNGDYVGEFQIGDGPSGPYGWVKCMALADNETFFDGIFDAFQDPACFISPFGRQPYVPISGIFGVDSAVTVADASGPTGLASVAAMQIDLSGAPSQHLAWAGSQVIDPATGDWVLLGELDSTTGWNPGPSDDWIFSCWAKVVPDANGVDVAGAALDFSIAVEGFGESGVTTSPQLILSDSWQFYQAIFSGLVTPTGPWCWPILRFSGAPLLNIVTYNRLYNGMTATLKGYANKGRILIKCPHLYQLTGVVSEGNWIDSFHGHG